jgi:CRP-like cAMP-binding protein
MANALTMKLEQFTRFDQVERQRLDELLTYPTKTYARGQDIIAEGQKVQDIHLVLTGLAARTKVLADGERQIIALLIPGDLCDVEVFVLEALDHNITAMRVCLETQGWMVRRSRFPPMATRIMACETSIRAS